MSFDTECFSMNSDMSKRMRLFSLPNRKEEARARGDFGFADAGGSQEQEQAGGTCACFEPGARTADGAGQHRNRFFLADDALVKLLLDPQELGRSLLP